MATTTRPPRRRKSTASQFDPSNLPTPSSAVATCSVVSNKWRLVFSTPVLVKALPTDFKVNNAAPIAYTQDSPTQMTLTFTVNVASGQSWLIPLNSKNVRTPTGGFVAAATGTF